MKRKSMILIVIFILLISSFANADNRIQISMNGTNLSVYKAPIILDGKMISSQIPTFVHDDRTLVHVRFIEENSDAKVSWIGETNEVVVEFDDGKVVMAIDSAIATINGEKRILDKGSIPRLVRFQGEKNSRTMVPLSFLAEALGFEVGWDSENRSAYINSQEEVKEPEEPEIEEIETEEEEEKKEQVALNTISQISVESGSTKVNKIVVKSDKNLSYDIKEIENNKWVIDFIGSELNIKNTKGTPGVINVDDNYIKDIKYSQLSYDPFITRIVVDMKKAKGANITRRSDGTGLIISFESKNIANLSKETVAGSEGIFIKGASEEDMKIMRLNNPERFVIDFLDSVLEGKTYVEYPYELGFIEKVRVSQFSVDNNYSISDQIVRVVLDLKGQFDDPNIRVEDYKDGIIIYPEESLWESIDLDVRDRSQIININNNRPTKHTIDYDNVSKELKIRFSKDDTDLRNGLIIADNHLIDRIEVSEIGGDKEILVRFKKSILYDVISKDNDKTLSISIERNRDLKPEDTLIVIDAGHGGRDSGAVSITGRKEKDFNLTMSKKFNAKLRAMGYNTIMTRDDDTFIDLYERPRIANENYADLFVSIHANSTGSSAINGVEMLYAPQGTSQVKEGEQYPFAKLMLDEVLKATKAHSRGVIQRPKLVVLRETSMPAVLVEAGFLSNAKEEQLLFTESYQDKIVDAMVRAVDKYFDMY